MKLLVFILSVWYKDIFGLVGGKNVSILQAPFQANYADVCGAVIIHTRWALTTAHCRSDGTFIRIGSSQRLSGPKIPIHRHILHPNYIGPSQFDYDIQLLRLHRKLRFWRHLRSVGICEECEGDVEVFGWGYQKERGDFYNHLQMITVQRVSLKECKEVSRLLDNSIELTSRMFCARGVGQDACQGDSGGAAVSSPSGLLVGLPSFGYGCGRGHPGVYVNLSEGSIRTWIKKYTD